MAPFKAAATEKKLPGMVLDIFVTVPCHVLPAPSYGPPIL